MLRTRILSRASAVFVAFCIGWLVYMVAMVLTVYDGLLSLIFQPILAALWSGFVVGLSLLVGLLLRLRPVSRVWNGSRRWAALIAITSVFILVFGYFVGITYIGVDPDTQQEIKILHPAAALGGYFFLLFSIANWPIRKAEVHGQPAA